MRIVYSSGHFPKNVKIYISNMFIYTENGSESDTRIKNNKLYYKTHQTYKQIFTKYWMFEERENLNF